MLKITKKLIKFNFSSGNDIKYIVVHDTANIDRVVRHYDASRKICPESMSHNNWKRWWNFKSRLSSSSSSQVKNNSDLTYGTVTASVLNVRSGVGTNYKVIGQLERGQKVRLDVKVGNWWCIYFGDHGGFVSADYIE